MGKHAKTKKSIATDAFWDDVYFISGGSEPIDDQQRLQDAIKKFFDTSPLVAQIEAVTDIINSTYKIGKITNSVQINETLKDAAIRYYEGFESVKEESIESAAKEDNNES